MDSGKEKNELKDITVGLEQRISAYESKLKDLRKKREQLNEEIATIEKYIELAKTLYRVEADKAKLASLSSQIITDETGALPPQDTDVTDQSREILLGRSKYVGMSVPDAVHMILKEARRSMHAKEICQHLVEGGMHIRGKTPVTSVATSLKRDRRFHKVAPNTFAIIRHDGETKPLTQAM
ncbi:HTH domain-containing protein [Candidatus Nitrospira salsa]